jgi:hypothetical protein
MLASYTPNVSPDHIERLIKAFLFVCAPGMSGLSRIGGRLQCLAAQTCGRLLTYHSALLRFEPNAPDEVNINFEVLENLPLKSLSTAPSLIPSLIHQPHHKPWRQHISQLETIETS